MTFSNYLRRLFVCICYGVLFLIASNLAFSNNPPNPNSGGQLLSPSSPDSPLSPEEKEARRKLKEAIKKAIKDPRPGRTKTERKHDFQNNIDKAIEEAKGNLKPEEIGEAAAEATAEALNELFGDDPANNDGRNPVNSDDPNSLTGDDVAEGVQDSLESMGGGGIDANTASKSFRDTFRDGVPDCDNYSI